jgi:cardiolipin synthase
MKSSRKQENPPRQIAENLRLFEGARAYFPALIEAIEGAVSSVQMETYLFNVFGTGADVGNALVRAAQRGVTVQVLVDGIGTEPLPLEWREKMRAANVQWCVYSPLNSRWAILQPLTWRRLHRKLCVVDQRIMFCGGINVLDDFFDPNHGLLAEPRFDFAISATGQLAVDAAEAVTLLWWRVQAGYSARQRHLSAAWEKFKLAGYGGRTRGTLRAAVPVEAGNSSPAVYAVLVLRDNLRNRSSIEKSYLKAIGQARQEIVIANAYFLPGGKLRRALINAARRGVKVTVLLQGKYEYFMQYHASRPVYCALREAGVEIHAYSKSFLHAKVAVIDGHWATVGSSNLDPLSLLLAREANVVVEGAAFASQLRAHLSYAIALQGDSMDRDSHLRRPFVKRALDWFAYGVMRCLLWLTGTRY